MTDRKIITLLERQNELLEAILRELRESDLPDKRTGQTTLTGPSKRSEARVLCPSCGYVIPPKPDNCPGCGWSQE